MWDVANITIAENSGMACSFGFELQVIDPSTGNPRTMRGDGLLLSDGRIRFNREEQLSQVARDLSLDAQQFIGVLAEAVRSRTNQLAATAV